MKKFGSILLAGLMTASLVGCSNGSASKPAETAKPEEGKDNAAETTEMKVAMITDYGDITDQSFNQTTYEACQKFCNDNGLEFEYKRPATDADADRIAKIEEAIDDGYNVIVMPGFAFAEAIYEVSPEYPDIKFVALDVSEGDLTAYGAREFKGDNVFSAVYQEEIAGYMAGQAAVKLGYRKLGFLGGMAVPAVVRYGYGFVQGANDAAKELGVTGDVEVKYTYGGQFFGDADITSVMDTWYQGGTEVVFACGGGIYTSAAEAAAKVDNGKVIGVDVDQAPIIDASHPDMTVTSAMKGLAATVDTVLGGIKDGKWNEYAGQIMNLGIVSGDDPTANYVQLPLATTQWNDTFTEADYRELVKKIAAGEITISNESDANTHPEVEIKVDYFDAIK